jgi:hypothetical protein
MEKVISKKNMDITQDEYKLIFSEQNILNKELDYIIDNYFNMTTEDLENFIENLSVHVINIKEIVLGNVINKLDNTAPKENQIIIKHQNKTIRKRRLVEAL